MAGKARPSLTIRDNEFLGDMAAWQRENSSDNSEQLTRVMRNLRLVRSQELTQRQEEMVHLYYDMGLNIPEIARQQGVCTSTVSRTLARARERLRRYLQYSF